MYKKQWNTKYNRHCKRGAGEIVERVLAPCEEKVKVMNRTRVVGLSWLV